MSLLSQLWCGEVQPACSLENSSAEICHLSELICKNREQLEAGLTDEQKKRLARCMECADEYRFLVAEEAFCRGVSLGLRLAAEALI